MNDSNLENRISQLDDVEVIRNKIHQQYFKSAR